MMSEPRPEGATRLEQQIDKSARTNDAGIMRQFDRLGKIEMLVDAEPSVNDCDGQELWWKCLRCGHQHQQGDVFEWIERGLTDVQCDKCGSAFDVQVLGEYNYDCYELRFSEREPT